MMLFFLVLSFDILPVSYVDYKVYIIAIFAMPIVKSHPDVETGIWSLPSAKEGKGTQK